MPALLELEREYAQAKKDRRFQGELSYYLKQYVGRPTPLYFAERLTNRLGGAKIYLKREDLCHTGAHKINNAIGQGLLARRMRKPRIIAETGAGQHGVATATVAAMFGLQCEIYMGTEDMQRQALNVFRMRLLGATVTGVDAGSRTLKDAISEAMRDWTTNIGTTHYILGSVLGAHPYPMMIRDFQSIIGKEARKQILAAEGRLPDCLMACVGGGSNAIGLVSRLLERQEGQDDRRRGRRAWRGQRQACGPVFRRVAGRVARDHDLSAAERGRPDQLDSFGIRPVWTMPPSAPNTAIYARSGGPPTRRQPTTRRWRHSIFSPGKKASFRRSKAPMPSPMWSKSHRR